MTGKRPRLRAVGRHHAGAVERRARFEAAHPEWTIVPPGNRWIAVGPPGMIPDDPFRTTVGDYELAGLMDQLEKICPPGTEKGTTC